MALKGHTQAQKGQAIDITLHVPAPYRLKHAEMDGDPVSVTTNGELSTMSFVPEVSDGLEWMARFERVGE